MNLVDRYIQECVHNRKYNWIVNNLYIGVNQLFSPTFGQQEILLTRDDKKAFLLPRNAGASTLICMDAIATCMLNPCTDIIIFCHNESACSHACRKMYEILGYSNINCRSLHNTNNNRILLENDSRILFMPPKEFYYIGHRPDVIYIDNFDMFNSEDLSNIFNRLMCCVNQILILGNNMNDFETTQRMININPRTI